jgi:hypothetical protein
MKLNAEQNQLPKGRRGFELFDFFFRLVQDSLYKVTPLLGCV